LGVTIVLLVGALLVPGHNFHLPDNLAIAHIENLAREYLGPVRVLAGHIKRNALLPEDLILDAVGHLPTEDVSQILSDLLLATQDVRRAGRGGAIDDEHLSVIGVEVKHRIEVALPCALRRVSKSMVALC
jgi:hypothetical protein